MAIGRLIIRVLFFFSDFGANNMQGEERRGGVGGKYNFWVLGRDVNAFNSHTVVSFSYVLLCLARKA